MTDKTIGTCKDCKFWGLLYEGVCDREQQIQTNKKSKFEIEVSALDDTDLSARLITGPDFGCVHFSVKD